ncbi:MAG: calcium-binding protein [Actinomycetota bacterium]
MCSRHRWLKAIPTLCAISSAALVVAAQAPFASSANAPTCLGRTATIVGTSHRDVIAGTSHADVIVSGKGDDRIDAKGGDDVVCSGPANDKILGGTGGDVINGGPGADSINSGPGFFDDVDGGPGDDSLNGGRDHQALVDYTTASAAVDVSLSSGKASGGAGKDTLTNFDSVQGSRFDDHLEGNDTAFGNGLFGGDGNDTLSAKDGPDVLVGEGGNDSLDGGDQPKGSTDFAGYKFAPGPVVVNLANGTATGWGTDTLASIEGIGGSDTFGDSLSGDNNDNVLIPYGGSDQVDGGMGEDLVVYASATSDMTIDLSTGVATGQGSDTLTNVEDGQGGPKNDTITGSSSPNRLFAGPGKDTISAGAGDDELNGGDGSDTLDGGDGDDTCIDGEKDTNCESKQHTLPPALLLVRLEGLAGYR